MRSKILRAVALLLILSTTAFATIDDCSNCFEILESDSRHRPVKVSEYGHLLQYTYTGSSTFPSREELDTRYWRTFDFDNTNKVMRKVVVSLGGPAVTYNFQYSTTGQLMSVTSSIGESVAMVYDLNSRISQLFVQGTLLTLHYQTPTSDLPTEIDCAGTTLQIFYTQDRKPELVRAYITRTGAKLTPTSELRAIRRIWKLYSSLPKLAGSATRPLYEF